MRPTIFAPKSQDLFPVIQSCVLHDTPLTLPEEAPKQSNATNDPPVGRSQPCSVNKNLTPTDSPERSLSASLPGREIESPINVNVYVAK